MKSQRSDYTHLGFIKSYMVPALLIFLVPLLSFFFFRHARDTFDRQARVNILAQIDANDELPPEQKAQVREFWNTIPLSRLIDDPQIAASLDDWTVFNYRTFAWMIRLSLLSIACGIGVFVLAGLCVVLSLHSQGVQYWSLMIGWHVLRISSALQTVILAVLLIALSFWVTALWLQVYVVKLILIVAVIAICVVCAVIAAIFKNPKLDFDLEGAVLDSETSLPFRDRLRAMCLKLGADPPDHIIAGIDDSFFVAERPFTVDGKIYRGKSLYVSLALLKQLNAAEADAVLAHEMAHFSGKDTMYSERISPLLTRFEMYLKVLHDGAMTIPVYYYARCFRALFELSLSKIRRQRELRADAIAASTTSPQDFAAALLRITAYSRFRRQVESDLYDHDVVLEKANVSELVESGFPAFAATFAADPNLIDSETPHPFDSHPLTAERIAALGLQWSSADFQRVLGALGDGGRWRDIPEAVDLERRQWQAYEELFRDFHEKTLAYRYLPATEEEREIVQRHFPDLLFEGTEGRLSIDCDTLLHASWSEPVQWSEVTQLVLSEKNELRVDLNRPGVANRSIRLHKYPAQQQTAMLDAVQRYYGRYRSAVEYQEEKAKEAKA